MQQCSLQKQLALIRAGVTGRRFGKHGAILSGVGLITNGFVGRCPRFARSQALHRFALRRKVLGSKEGERLDAAEVGGGPMSLCYGLAGRRNKGAGTRRSNRLTAIAWAIVLLGQAMLPSATAQQDGPRVMMINSYHPQYQWTAEMVRGVQDSLFGVVAEEDLHVEYLDARRFADDPVHRNRVSELIAYKLQMVQPDLIISTDDYALEYLLGVKSQLLGDVPIVFCGVNTLPISRLAEFDDVTGIYEGIEIEGNLDLILRLQPQTRRIVMLSDQTAFGQRLSATAREVMAQWSDDSVTLELWEQQSFTEMGRRLARALPGDVALMLAIHRDTDGYYFSYQKDLPRLSADASVPIYGMWGGLMLGNGVVGGLMNDPYQHASEAAQMALSILGGTAPSELPVIPKAQYLPRFDDRQLERFGISHSRLPIGSDLIYEQHSFWERYGPLVVGAVALFLFLIGIIVALLNSNLRRRRAEDSLRQLNVELEQRVEQRTADLNEKNQELTRVSEQMQRWANTDALTELPNRRRGVQLLRRHLIRALADVDTLSVALVDVDQFKPINDEYGHQTGDKVLQELARRLAGAIRPGDFLCRWGGEEFLIIFPGLNRDDALAVCERLREQLSVQPIPPLQLVTASFGIAQLQQGDSLESLVKRADEAMYQAKRSGRDQVVVS